MSTEPTEPGVEDAPEVEDIAETEDEAEQTETEDQETEDEDSAEPDEVEIEIDGQKYRVPASLKDNFMLRADYTRKTQELADSRKAFEQRVTQAEQAEQSEVEARARVFAIDAAIQQYQNVDWDALEAQDPVGAQRHFRTFMQLQQQRQDADKELGEARQSRELEAQRVAAERVEQGIAELQRDIPGWGADLASKLLDFGEKQFGLSRDFMESVDDPKLVKLLHATYAALNPSTKPKQAAQAPAVRPAAKVKGGGSPPARGLDDRLSQDEWLKRRNAQLAR